MTPLTGLILAAALLAVIVRFALKTAGPEPQGPAPQRRPVWLGPDAVAIATALRRALDDRRAQAGAPPLLACPTTDELASHHAFDMASRGYGAEEDPEGVDLGERRHRLHPRYVGRLWEFDLLLEPATPSTEDSLLGEIRRSPAWGEATARLMDPKWNALGLGVAVEGGRCGVTLVFGAWWADIEGWEPGEAGVGGWRTRGRAAPDQDVATLAGRLEDGPVVPATPHEDAEAHPRDFRLVLPQEGDATGLRATILRGGEVGLIQRVR